VSVWVLWNERNHLIYSNSAKLYLNWTKSKFTHSGGWRRQMWP
jgi:hypothetical protein